MASASCNQPQPRVQQERDKPERRVGEGGLLASGDASYLLPVVEWNQDGLGTIPWGTGSSGVTVSGSGQMMSWCGISWCGLLGTVVFGWRLDLMTLEAFPSLNDSMIPWLCDLLPVNPWLPFPSRECCLPAPLIQPCTVSHCQCVICSFSTACLSPSILPCPFPTVSLPLVCPQQLLFELNLFYLLSGGGRLFRLRLPQSRGITRWDVLSQWHFIHQHH